MQFHWRGKIIKEILSLLVLSINHTTNILFLICVYNLDRKSLVWRVWDTFKNIILQLTANKHATFVFARNVPVKRRFRKWDEYVNKNVCLNCFYKPRVFLLAKIAGNLTCKLIDTFLLRLGGNLTKFLENFELFNLAVVQEVTWKKRQKKCI